MTTDNFIIALFCRIHDVMKDIPKHHQANLYLSEIITLGNLLTSREWAIALSIVGGTGFQTSVPQIAWMYSSVSLVLNASRMDEPFSGRAELVECD